MLAAPNVYSLPNMLGQTKQSGVRQAPCYSLTGRSKIGGFHEDLQKVKNSKSDTFKKVVCDEHWYYCDNFETTFYICIRKKSSQVQMSEQRATSA